MKKSAKKCSKAIDDLSQEVAGLRYGLQSTEYVSKRRYEILQERNAEIKRLKEQEEYLEAENQRLRESVLDLHLVIQELRHEGL